jgi:aminocarboxymuconate-semialdehyde decarboxylase
MNRSLEGMTIYDVHAHCVPHRFLAELRRDGRRLGAEVIPGSGGPQVRFAGGQTTRPARGDLTDVDARLASMDRARLDVQVLSSWIDLTGYMLSRDVALHYTRMLNDTLAATVAEHPDRFLALCNVPLQEPVAAAEELVRAVTEDGFVGAEIATSVEELPLGDPALYPFWSAAEELRSPILIHPSYVPAAGGMLDLIENVVGRPAASTTALAHMVLGGVLERFPELRLVLVHGGGFVPWQVARWDRGVRRSSLRPDSPAPSAQLGNVYYDAILYDPQVIGYLVDWAGAERVVLGTDYPFPSGDLTPVDTLDEVLGLSESQRSAIQTGNAERLFAEIRR